MAILTRMKNHIKVVLAIIYHQAGSTLVVEIDLMKRSLRNLTSIIKNTKNTRIRRSTKSITHPSQKKGRVQKNAKGPKREDQARIEARGDIIIAVREINSHPEVAICNLLLLHLIGAKDTLLVTSRAMVVLAFHQIEGTEVMSLEVGILHHINHNPLHTNMEEPNMKKAKIATTIATIKVEVIQRAADSAVATQSSISSRTSHRKNSAGSLIFVSKF